MYYVSSYMMEIFWTSSSYVFLWSVSSVMSYLTDKCFSEACYKWNFVFLRNYNHLNPFCRIEIVVWLYWHFLSNEMVWKQTDINWYQFCQTSSLLSSFSHAWLYQCWICIICHINSKKCLCCKAWFPCLCIFWFQVWSSFHARSHRSVNCHINIADCIVSKPLEWALIINMNSTHKF